MKNKLHRIERLGGRSLAYTLIGREQVTDLLKLAGLGVDETELISIQPLKGGWANSNFILTLKNNTKLVLKGWDERPPEEVKQVTQSTLWLSEHGCPTPVPMELQNGERMAIVDGMAWMIIPFIEGGWLPTDTASLFDLGRVLANLHSIPDTIIIPRNFALGFDYWEKLSTTAISENIGVEFAKLLATEATALREKIPPNLPHGIIHADLFPDNVIGIEGKVLALLDFEEICIGPFVFDIMMTYAGFGWKDGQPLKESLQALLDGYQSIRKLTPEEHAALPNFHRYATLSIAAWRFWQFMIKIPGTKHADRYLEMVGRLNVDLPL